MNAPVLVIGGAGYIGSHLCKSLAHQGYTPIVYDSLRTGHKEFVRFGPLLVGDLLDTPYLESVLKEYHPSAVFHLAADSHARETSQKALTYYQNNLGGTLSLLQALSKHPVPYLLFSSSAAVYGESSTSPIPESSPLIPLSYYGRTKLACEFAIHDFCQGQNIQYAFLRYFNAAGADPEGEIGERHTPETHLIPLLIQVLKKELSHFTLFGKPHKTEDTTAIRDFIHVTDLAIGHLQALEWLQAHSGHLTLNLGSGQGYSILQIISALERKVGSSIPLLRTHEVEEPSCLVADITNARTLLGFTPEHSSLDSILDTALRWHL
ncbi:MAG: UDP-glucose 4-epimerase GalE [Chlamydiae bacterium]|nr:UDP-glucose 4-epimerase GalE [Chlamydiota bacterium]